MQEDFKKYCKQIGILPNEMPRLVTDKKTMDELKKTFSDGGIGRSTSRCYGICYWEDRTIYVNTKKRIRRYRLYKHVEYTKRYATKPKQTYRDILHTMIHELVHYRFKYLQHGAKYEQRIKEILHGKVFPQKQLYDVSNTPDISASIESPHNT